MTSRRRWGHVGVLALVACSSASKPTPPPPEPAAHDAGTSSPRAVPVLEPETDPPDAAVVAAPDAAPPHVDAAVGVAVALATDRHGGITTAFRDCKDGSAGQIADATGTTCAEVCAAFGYKGCRGRAAQADYDACRGPAELVGPCDQPFQMGWSSSCNCTAGVAWKPAESPPGPRCGNGKLDMIQTCQPQRCPPCAVGSTRCECTSPCFEQPEPCDGARLGGKTCRALGFTGGTLRCTQNCTLDTSRCTR